MAFDVASIVREYTQAYLGVSPNRARPIDLLPLVDHLDRFTDQLHRRGEKRRRLAGAAAQCDQLCIDLQRWERRLDFYLIEVNAQTDENDRWATLYTITNPLFLGWYGGPQGEAGPEFLAETGFGPGFRFDMQHPPDLATPYSLANQLDVAEAFEAENRQHLLDDLKSGAEEIVTGVQKAGKRAAKAVGKAAGSTGVLLTVAGLGAVAGVAALALLKRQGA